MSNEDRDATLDHIDEWRCGNCGDWLTPEQIVGHGFAEGSDLRTALAPLATTWCREHHAYDHCEDQTLARLASEPSR